MFSEVMAFSKQTVRIQEAKDENAVYALIIPKRLMHEWHLQRNDGCSVWEKMNSCIDGQSLMVSDVVEQRLRARAAKCYSTIEGSGGRKKKGEDERWNYHFPSL